VKEKKRRNAFSNALTGSRKAEELQSSKKVGSGGIKLHFLRHSSTREGDFLLRKEDAVVLEGEKEKMKTSATDKYTFGTIVNGDTNRSRRQRKKRKREMKPFTSCGTEANGGGRDYFNW